MNRTSKLAAIAHKLNAINAEAELALMQEETARKRDERDARMGWYIAEFICAFGIMAVPLLYLIGLTD